MPSLRSPICVVVGHVDHGKSSILDWIRRSSIVSTEKGGITQAIGASIVPFDTIRAITGDLLKAIKGDITLSGLLFIDTPGHEAFTNLRRRGGSIADLAILVVDINEGFRPQTKEAIEILRQFKVPFVVAANKLDLIPGWRQQDKPLALSIPSQPQSVQEFLDKKLYELVGRLSEHSINADRFDRVSDFTQSIAIIPTSAKTGEGLPELLMILTGLAQRYLGDCLRCDPNAPAKGTILEVKEQRGLGPCIDVILYDGTLHVDDTIIIGGLDAPIQTKVRALFEPADNVEMRDERSHFVSVREASASTGVRISAPLLEGTFAGMPVRAAIGDIEAIKADVAREVAEVLVETDEEGIILKADSLGSLEALVGMLRERKIPIRKASVGQINRKDILDADANNPKKPLMSVVLGFNVVMLPDAESLAKDRAVKVITDPIIYKLIDDIESWQRQRSSEIDGEQLSTVTRPCKLEVMKGYVFRQSNPAVVGIEVLSGTLKSGTSLMKDGKNVTTVRAMQLEKESISTAEAGKQVAVSLDRVTIGRQVMEGDILYSSIIESEYRKLRDVKDRLTPQEITVVKEIAEIMRRENPLWGV